MNEHNEVKQRKLAPVGTLLEKNLSFFLKNVKKHFGTKKPDIRHVLLHLYRSKQKPCELGKEEKRLDGFTMVGINCCSGMVDDTHYIEMKIK